MEEPPKKFFRLAPGPRSAPPLRLLHHLHERGEGRRGQHRRAARTYDPATRGGDSPDGRKPKATLHWVSADHAVDCEVRLYDRLFSDRESRRRAATFSTISIRSRCEIVPRREARAVRPRRRAVHALPVRAPRLLLRRSRLDRRAARLQPHGDVEGHLGESGMKAFEPQRRRDTEGVSQCPLCICGETLLPPHV